MVRSIDGPASKESRANERYAADPSASCYVTDLLDQTLHEAGVWNASLGGVCVVIEPAYPPGTRVTLELRHPSEERALRAFAEVVHTMEVPSHHQMWMTGLEFLCLPLPAAHLKPFCVRRGNGGPELPDPH
jgi:hypothetical protein